MEFDVIHCWDSIVDMSVWILWFAIGSRGDRTLAAEVLTSSGKQIAYHTCVALRQYFRAHLLLLVDSLRPIRSHKSGSRSGPSGRATYKPLDISNEAMDAIIIQLQRDRKLGPGFVRARWVPLELFMVYNGHIVLLELTQVCPLCEFFHFLGSLCACILYCLKSFHTTFSTPFLLCWCNFCTSLSHIFLHHLMYYLVAHCSIVDVLLATS